MQPPVIPKGDFSLPFLATLDSAVNQQGAQMDAWNHMAAPGRNGRTYNCYNLLDNNNLYTVPDVQDPSGTMFAGFKGMGIDAIGSVITGASFWMFSHRRKNRLVSQGADVSNFPPAGFFYASEDLEDAMVREGLRINDFEPGDVIFVRTGDAYKYWTEDPEKPRNDRLGFYNNQAQVDDRAGQWIVNRNAVAYASDTAGGPHYTLLPQGVTLMENLDLEMLSKDAHARYTRSQMRGAATHLRLSFSLYVESRETPLDADADVNRRISNDKSLAFIGSAEARHECAGHDVRCRGTFDNET